MDNGAYEKYRQENPVVNTLLTTYEHLTLFPEKLTNTEISLLAIFALLALYALVKLVKKLKKKGS